MRNRRADVRREREIEMRYLKIERENVVMMQKMNKIFQQPNHYKTYDMKLKNSRKHDGRRMKMQKIVDENARIAQRIKNAPSFLDPGKWERDFERHVHMSRHMQGLQPIPNDSLRRRKRGGSRSMRGSGRGTFRSGMSGNQSMRRGEDTGRSRNSLAVSTGRSLMSGNSAGLMSPMSTGRSGRGGGSGRGSRRRDNVLSGPGGTRPQEKGGHGGYSLDTRLAGSDIQYRPKGWRDDSGSRLGPTLPGKKLKPIGASRGSGRSRRR